MQPIADLKTPQTAHRDTTRQLESRSLYAIAKAQQAGNMVFDGHTPSAEEKTNAMACRKLCDEIERQLQSCPVGDVPMLLGYYDLLHLVGHRSMPRTDIRDSHTRRVINAWKSGDPTIEESDVFGLIALDAAYRPEKAGREKVEIYRTLKARWLETLTRHDRFPRVTTKENYERLALIMRENLDPQFGPEAAAKKRRWYAANRIDDLDTLSTTLLRSYRRLVAALYPDVLSRSEQQTLDTRLLTALSHLT